MTVRISLGSEKRVSGLYSFQNSPTCPWTREETVKHWFDMTLERDGLAAKGARSTVAKTAKGYELAISGPPEIQSELERYADRLPQFLDNGSAALNTTIPKIKKAKRWDPSPDSTPPPYLPWRFFMPHGMAMLNQKALLFFHYPPIRLLETNQDYLDDPVPVRCTELLTANGVKESDLPLFNTVMDATPIGAEDDQGSKKGGDNKWGLIPIQDFHAYQKAQVKLLLNDSPRHAAFTVPIVVYGSHPRETFNVIYKKQLTAKDAGGLLKNNGVSWAQIVPDKMTPIMASTHPYVFYGDAQGFDNIGSGKLINPGRATGQMIKDLTVSRWLVTMSDDPSQHPKTVLQRSKAYWNDPANAAVVDALVNHQGSLYYSNPTTLTFEFLKPLPSFTSIASSSAPAKKKKPQPAAKTTKKSKKQTGRNVTTVIGDSGKPVDWWFIYKVSKHSHTTARRSVTGAEYAYFDADMAGQEESKLTLSPNRIDNSSALTNTLSPLFSEQAKENPNLGWYCYNDEDHYNIRKNGQKSGTGPSDRGHCKGTVAFDLESDTGYWLIHSVPLLPLEKEFDFPDTGFAMAQTMLCIQLKDADTARHIAQLMYDAHGPNVLSASDLLVKSKKKPNGYAKKSLPVTNVPKVLSEFDPRLLLMQDKNGSTSRPVPYCGRVPFMSQGGQRFLAIAKNRAWGNSEIDKQGARDFYNDLVAPTLKEDIEVETWERAHGNVPEEQKKGDKHKVENMQSVDLNNVGIPYSWSESNDHAKLAISDRENPKGTDRWVCVGDINFTDAQEKRGGGTVAFKCESLWQNLVEVLESTPEPPKKKSSKKKKTKSSSKKKSVNRKKKAPAKKSAKKKKS